MQLEDRKELSLLSLWVDVGFWFLPLQTNDFTLKGLFYMAAPEPLIFDLPPLSYTLIIEKWLSHFLGIYWAGIYLELPGMLDYLDIYLMPPSDYNPLMLIAIPTSGLRQYQEMTLLRKSLPKQ